VDSAAFLVTQSLGTVKALQQSVDRWFLLALALTVAAALTLAAWAMQPLDETALATP